MSLRRQLTLSYALVALAGLLLASLVGAVLVRQSQVRAAEQTVTLITNVIARARLNGVRPNNPDVQRMVEAVNGRLLLVDGDNIVLEDSATGDGSMQGDSLNARAALVSERQAEGRPTIRQARLDGELYYFSTVPIGTLRTGNRLIVALPTASVLQSWFSLLPGMILVSGLGFILATIVGYRISQKVTTPLTDLKTAANGMAGGDYDSRVDSPSDIQELQVLATSFNTMADEVQRARNTQRDFLANVSHDLRTPLTSIQGFSQALKDGDIPATQTPKVATIIYTEAGRLARLVNDLLDLARIEAGRFTLAKQDINLRNVLRDTTEKFEQEAKTANVALDIRIPRRALPISGDADRLTQVFTNLVDNALTYAQRGGKHVTISAELGGIRSLKSYAHAATPDLVHTASVAAAKGTSALATATASHDTAPQGAVMAPPAPAPTLNGTVTSATIGDTDDNTPAPSDTGGHKLGRWWVEIKIGDDGPGIPDTEKGQIFERFYRGDKSRTGGGLGLGLAIAKEIVEAHGGEIKIEDNQPEGTCFVVRLPMKMW